MIRRVMTPTSARAAAPTWAGLPPGTPEATPLQLVYIYHSMVATMPTDSLITADGAPVYATGPQTWDQLLAGATVIPAGAV